MQFGVHFISFLFCSPHLFKKKQKMFRRVVVIGLLSCSKTQAFLLNIPSHTTPRGDVAFAPRVAAFDASEERVNLAVDSIDRATEAFLAQELDTDSFLSAIEDRLAEVENRRLTSLPVEHSVLPKEGQHVEQVMHMAKEGAVSFINGCSLLAKEAVDFVETTKESLPNIKVGQSETTYDEALDKVAKGAQGMWTLCSSFGEFLKHEVTRTVHEVQADPIECSPAQTSAKQSRPQQSGVEFFKLPFFAARKFN